MNYKVLLIDNYDSFTFNIKHMIEPLGCEVTIIKNDDLQLLDLEMSYYSHIILSPGPGCPKDSGLTFNILKRFYQRIPILGICLGHQCLAQWFGATINYASKVQHGKIAIIKHANQSLFTAIPQYLQVVRYHSLIINRATLPDCLDIIAWTVTTSEEIDEIMAIQHKKFPLFGVQYHPESILSEYGRELFSNFLTYKKDTSKNLNNRIKTYPFAMCE